MRRIITLAVPGTPLFELGTPARLFGAAHDTHGNPLYDMVMVSATGSPELRAREATVAVSGDLGLLATADAVVVTSSDDLLDPSTARELARTLAPHLVGESRPRSGLQIASICSGAFLLGHLGLLTNRPVTTHWRLASQLTQQFPGAHLHSGALYVDDGDILTSGGVAAGIDLCLHMIRRNHGTAIANDVARSCIVAPLREGGQAQFITTPVTQSDALATSETARWLLDTLERPHTLAGIAQHAHMSTRTFERRFQAEHGMAPGQWLIQARVQRAKELLETTDLPVERIAALVGMGTGSNLRVHFARCTGRSPQSYRRTFSTPAAD